MDFLLERFRGAPEKEAFIHNDKSYSYSWLLQKINEYGDFLNKNDISNGEIIMLVADYSPQAFSLFCALMLNKNIVVPITAESVVERSVTVELSECSRVLQFSEDLSEVLIEKITKKSEIVGNKLLSKFLVKGNPGVLLFSSGSTGKPKGILIDFNAMLKKFETKRTGIRAISFLMFDHFGGINTIFHMLSNLGTVITVSKRSVEEICSAVQKHKVELLPTTPSFLNMLVRSNAHEHFDLSSLKIITYGTEVMSQTTLDMVRKNFPDVKLQQTYGLSELGVLRSKSREDGSLWVKIGGEGFKTKVVDGILWIKSDFAMVGYINAPDPFDSEGWFCTQDAVEVDGEYYRILGRTTDIINIGGQKVYPAEVESVISKLHNIKEVSVRGETNPLLGQIIVAEVVTHEPESLAEIKKKVRKACLEELASFKVPSKVVLSERDMYSKRMKKIRHDNRDANENA